ncbi:hypothetical protein [Leifsonia sp. LS-T14]|uniref:hypothetical protein n=1 Tax=unclassified Leifsonia TaxID=2663824 RepID=UPI0035A650FD
MRNLSEEFGELALDGFTLAQGLAAGISRHRLYRADVQRPFHGVRTVGAELHDHLALCRAYAAREHDGDAFSHFSAAIIHRLPLPRHFAPHGIDVAVFAPRKPSRVRGVIPHELRPAGHRVVDVGGLRCMSAQDTWAQLSGQISLTDLIVMGDYLLTGDEPYSGKPSPWTRADLEAACRRHGRRPGVRNLRLALERIRYGSLSPQESRLRVELVDAGLPEPELNLRISEGGTFIAMVDLAYPEHRVAVEYLGDHHRTDDETYQADIRRRERLMSVGWNVVFVTAADLRGPVPRAVLTVRRALAIASSVNPRSGGVSAD